MRRRRMSVVALQLRIASASCTTSSAAQAWALDALVVNRAIKAAETELVYCDILASRRSGHFGAAVRQARANSELDLGQASR